LIEGNASAQLHFIENAHYELYAFCTRKGVLLKEIQGPIGVAPSPLNPPLHTHTHTHTHTY